MVREKEEKREDSYRREDRKKKTESEHKDPLANAKLNKNTTHTQTNMCEYLNNKSAKLSVWPICVSSCSTQPPI